MLTDIEGNFPKDLAEKHHHSKCVKYLASRERNKTERTRSNSTKMVCSHNHCMVTQPHTTLIILQDPELTGTLKRQQNASKAEMIDSYRNAPPHQVSAIKSIMIMLIYTLQMLD